MQLVVRVALGFLAGLFFLAPQAALPASTDTSTSQDYLVKVWGADEGLTEGSVTDVAQTPEGYLRRRLFIVFWPVCRARWLPRQ